MRSSALVRDPASVPAASVKANSAAAVIAAAARGSGTDVLTATATDVGAASADAADTAASAEQDSPTKRDSAAVITLANAVANRSTVNVAAPPKMVPVPVTPTCLAFRCQELGAGGDRSSTSSTNSSSSRSSVSAALKCTLIAGDEGGYIRVWDVTSLLTKRLQLRPVLQPAALPSKRQMPTGNSSNESNSSAKQQQQQQQQPQQRRKQEQKYLRSGPTDGVTVQRACRLKALLDFAAQLRCGEALTAPRSLGTSSSSDSSVCKAAAVAGNSSGSSNKNCSGRHKRNSAVGSTSDDVLFMAATAAAGVGSTSSGTSNNNSSGATSAKTRPASRKGSAEVLKQQQQLQQQRRTSRNIALASSGTTTSSAAAAAAGSDSVHDGRRMSRTRRSSAISASSDADTSDTGVLQYDTAGEERERDSSYSEAARQEDICSAYAQVLHVSAVYWYLLSASVNVH
jgi:hypothetical protein